MSNTVKKNFPVITNRARAGYFMLMILSVVDGHYDVAEGAIIVDYLAKEYALEFDIDEANKELVQNATKDDTPDFFRHCTIAFQEVSTEEERLDFLAFAYRLAEADGKVVIAEQKIISSLATFWGFNVDVLFEDGIKKLMNS